MPVINRDVDKSQQRDIWNVVTPTLATGVTCSVFIAPYPCVVESVQVAGMGISGAPIWDFEILRFVTGSGVTNLGALGSSITVQMMGTSGVQSLSLLASGSTLLNLNTSDCVVVKTGASNAASINTNVSIVTRALQDIKSQFGL